MSAPDQWTVLSASVGPDEDLYSRWLRLSPAGQVQAEHDRYFRRGLAIGESKERTRQLGHLRAAYRRGRLDGFVRLGLAVVGLAAWAAVVGRGR